MPLSRKHYQSIAAIFKAHSRRALNDADDNGGADIWLSIRDDIADYLAGDNPNFDRDRFRRATEPDGKGEPDAPGEPARLKPTETETPAPSYMAIDQHGATYHDLGPHPRKELAERLGATHISKIFQDTKDGRTYQVGYHMRGLWLTLYTVRPFRKTA